jgi:hypothetical protein
MEDCFHMTAKTQTHMNNETWLTWEAIHHAV